MNGFYKKHFSTPITRSGTWKAMNWVKVKQNHIHSLVVVQLVACPLDYLKVVGSNRIYPFVYRKKTSSIPLLLKFHYLINFQFAENNFFHAKSFPNTHSTPRIHQNFKFYSSLAVQTAKTIRKLFTSHRRNRAVIHHRKKVVYFSSKNVSKRAFLYLKGVMFFEKRVRLSYFQQTLMNYPWNVYHFTCFLSWHFARKYGVADRTCVFSMTFTYLPDFYLTVGFM